MPEGLAQHMAPRARRISLTPLIDMIFVLLLFFMLSSTFSQLGEIDLAVAAGGQAERPAQAPVFVQLGPDLLRLNGQETTMETFVDALDPFSGPEGGGLVLVSLLPEVTAQRLTDLLALLRGQTAWQLQVLE